MRPAEAIAEPIACTLDGDTLAKRLDRIRALTIDSLLSHELRGRELRLAYRLDAADEVRAIVALERRCCAFLHFEIEVDARFVELTIAAPPNAGEAGPWLFAQFLPDSGAPPSGKACGCNMERTCA